MSVEKQVEEKVSSVVPRGMEVVKPVQGILTDEQKQAVQRNLIKYVAPTLALFFGQLAAKVDWKIAGFVALLAFYQGLSDYFGKLNNDTPYLRDK